jgi:hypothetical protein
MFVKPEPKPNSKLMLIVIPSAPITQNPMLYVRPSSRSVKFNAVSKVAECVPVRWLGSSFAFFVGLCVLAKNANVLPKASAISNRFRL